MTGGVYPQFYPLIMLTAIATGFLLSRKYKRPLKIDPLSRAFLGLSAFCGAIIAAKLPFFIPWLPGFVSDDGNLIGGKTVLLGLVGGYFGVEIAKRYLGYKTKTGDTFVVPVAASIAIGRLSCFCGGCCYGKPTDLPWGMRFVTADELYRHPAQLYEFAFHAVAAICSAWMIRKRIQPGQLIKLYFLSYFGFRFLTEFLRPEPQVWGGLTVYQLCCVPLFVVFYWLYFNDARKFARGEIQSVPPINSHRD